MAKKTALEMIQIVGAKVGTEEISSIEDKTTGEHRLLLAALNAANTKIITSYMWNELILQSTFMADKTVGSGWIARVEGYDLNKIAPGFLGFINKFILCKPENVPYSFATMDEYLNAKIFPALSHKFLIKEKCLCFLEPQPASTNSFTFYYKSNNAVLTTKSGALANAVSTDEFCFNNDTAVLDDQLLISGATIEYKSAKGIDIAYDEQQYQMLLNSLRDVNAANAILGEFPSNSDNTFRVTATGNSVSGK
jgi:hypothetical protein